MSSTKPARGMRDFLPADVRRRTYVIDVVREVYERYGFEPLETPAVENLETLMGKYGEEGNQLIFAIQKRGEQFEAALDGLLRATPGIRTTPGIRASTPLSLSQATHGAGEGGRGGEGEVGRGSASAARELSDLALRYDLTVPLARVVAEYRAQLPKFFKRYQIQPVWRADRPARGRFREFYQCDVDILGTNSLVVEAELCAAASDVLSRLGFANFVVRMNHRQLLSAILDAAGVPGERASDVLVALDKLDKIGDAGVEAELAERGIEASVSQKLLGLFTEIKGYITAIAANPGGESREEQNGDVLKQLDAFVGDHDVGRRALAELREILAHAASTSASGRVEIDPSLARGLSYYTGAIMEIAVPDLAGSLGGGGRYDNLVGMFLGQDVPACGFSLGLERIIVVMTERGMFPEGLESAPADVMVTLWHADHIGDALALARDLRRASAESAGTDGRPLRVDVYPEPDKIGKQFKYASGRGIPKVAVVGDDERAQGTVTIKDMRTGAQQTVPRARVADACRE